jgi:glycosyltransferase involved in cell wall biosynthesis
VFVEVRHGDYLQFGPLDTSRRDQRPTGLFFGRIRDYKGVDVLLDALPIIHTRIPDFRLIVAGSGADRRLRRRLFESEGVEFEDRFIEDREIPVLFGRANVVILPYGEASWSGVASLAANFGVPVIASAIDGLLDHLAPDTAARLVPPGDPQRLADAVTEHFLDDWGGSDARQSRAVVEQVSWGNAASITVATYCKLLS